MEGGSRSVGMANGYDVAQSGGTADVGEKFRGQMNGRMSPQPAKVMRRVPIE